MLFKYYINIYIYIKEKTLKEFLLLQQGTLYDYKSPIENNKELLIVTSFTR